MPDSTLTPLVGAVRALASDLDQWLPLVGTVDLISSEVFHTAEHPQVIQSVMVHPTTLVAIRAALPASTDPELAAMLYVVLTRQLRA
jgi:hypothetical protein